MHLPFGSPASVDCFSIDGPKLQMEFFVPYKIDVNYLNLLFQFQWTIRNCFCLYNLFWQIFWVFLWSHDQFWAVFIRFFFIKINKLHFYSEKCVFSRPSRCLRFPLVLHGYLDSEVHGFFRRVDHFCDFHFHRWPPVVHRWPWRKVAQELVDHRWSTNGSTVGVPWTTDNHSWDHMESQYGYLQQSRLASGTNKHYSTNCLCFAMSSGSLTAQSSNN